MADRNYDDELQALRDDMARLREDIGRLTHAFSSDIGDQAEDMRRSVEDEFRTRREILRARLDQARVRGQRKVEDLEESIADHPLGSLATAVGIGFILAKMMDLGGGRR